MKMHANIKMEIIKRSCPRTEREEKQEAERNREAVNEFHEAKALQSLTYQIIMISKHPT